MTTADAAPVLPGKIDIMHVARRTWDLIRPNFGADFGFAMLLVGIPATVMEFLTASSNPDDYSGGKVGLILITVVAVVVASLAAEVALIRNTLRRIEGESGQAMDHLSEGLRTAPAALGFSLLAGLAMMFGLLLLIVPGLMMATAWAVGLPVLVAERPGVMAVFRRSADLTRGNRWRILGLFCLWIAIAIGAALVIGLVTAVLSLLLGTFTPAAVGVMAVLNGAFSALGVLVGATAATVLYHELTRDRPSRAVQEIVDILR